MHVEISTGTVNTKPIGEIGTSKNISRWIPQGELSRRISCKVRQKPRPRRNMKFQVTGDESWSRDQEPLSKEINKVWVLIGARCPFNSFQRAEGTQCSCTLSSCPDNRS